MPKRDNRGSKHTARRLNHFDPLELRLFLSAAQLVKEINTASPASAPANFVSINRTTYFTTDDGVRGTELWRTDGTPGGTRLVKDIEPGPAASSPTNLIDVAGTLYFIAQTSQSGAELWTSDGTEGGTVQVTDLVPGSDPGVNRGSGLAVAGNKVLFAKIVPGVLPGYEIWASDGTAAGTQPLAGAKRWSTLQLSSTVAVGNWTYFGGQGNGAELWRTDGTPTGSTLVESQQNSAIPVPLVNLNGQLAFTASDNVSGAVLWMTDGTPAGTRPIAGSANAGPWTATNPVVVGGKMYFQAMDPESLYELWVSDGTTAGTHLVKDINPGFNGSSQPENLVALGDMVYFKAASPGADLGLWRTDGTDAGTVRVMTFLRSPVASTVTLSLSRGVLYVSGPDGDGAGDLWKITSAGAPPVLVRDELDAARPLFNVPQGAVFTGNDGGGPELWFTDGTTAGTRQVTPLRPGGEGGADPRTFANLGDRYVFYANDGVHGVEPWVTDGTDVGTHLVRDINPGAGSGVASTLRGGVLNGVFYFGATDGAGYELWRSDGTAEGTHIFYEFKPGLGGLSVSMNNFTEYNGALYFNASTGAGADFQLWRTDGTAAGTVRMSDGYANVPAGLAAKLRVVNGALYFVNTNAAGTSTSLYRFNGSAVSRVVTEANDFGAAGTTPIAFDDTGFASVQLYRPNASGTWTQLTLVPGHFGKVFGDAGGILYFVHSTDNEGTEVWQTDGTVAGTHIVKDLYGGSGTAAPANPFTCQGRFYFTARSGAFTSLWVIDAPGAAPRKLLDLGNASITTPVVAYADFRNTLYFQAVGKLWRINASGDAEIVEADMPQPTNLGFVTLGDTLLFGVQDPQSGSELFRYPALPDTRPPAVADAMFQYWTAQPTVSIRFDEDVTALSTANALVFENLATGQMLTASSVLYNPDTRTAVFTFDAGLPNGQYRASLAAGAVADAAANASAAWSDLTFVALGGDTNRDGQVNFTDLLTLARNYNSAGDATYTQGDFNNDGFVNFADLLTLARNYNQSVVLAALTPLPLPMMAKATASAPAKVFSTTPVPAAKPKPTKPAKPPARKR